MTAFTVSSADPYFSGCCFSRSEQSSGKQRIVVIPALPEYGESCGTLAALLNQTGPMIFLPIPKKDPGEDDSAFEAGVEFSYRTLYTIPFGPGVLMFQFGKSKSSGGHDPTYSRRLMYSENERLQRLRKLKDLLPLARELGVSLPAVFEANIDRWVRCFWDAWYFPQGLEVYDGGMNIGQYHGGAGLGSRKGKASDQRGLFQMVFCGY